MLPDAQHQKGDHRPGEPLERDPGQRRPKTSCGRKFSIRPICGRYPPFCRQRQVYRHPTTRIPCLLSLRFLFVVGVHVTIVAAASTDQQATQQRENQTQNRKVIDAHTNGTNLAKQMLAKERTWSVLRRQPDPVHRTSPTMAAAVRSFDALDIDLEHNPTSLETAAFTPRRRHRLGYHPDRPGVLARPARLYPHPRLWRPGRYGPHVNNAAEALSDCRGLPLRAARLRLGRRNRAVAGRRAALPQPEICRRLTEETLLMAMIESPEAVANADAIAAVEGIDVLHIGSTDLSTEMGIPGEYKHDLMRDAYHDHCKGGPRPRQVDGRRWRPPGRRVPVMAAETRRALPNQRIRQAVDTQWRTRRREADQGGGSRRFCWNSLSHLRNISSVSMTS